jgi:hypothetical protein
MHDRVGSDGRAKKLEALKAFGLYVRGGLTYWQIAQQLQGLVERNPSSAAGNARTRVFKGWDLVRHQGRWNRGDNSHRYALPPSGARRATYPPPPPPPPPPQLTPLEELLERLVGCETFARERGLHAAANGIRGLRTALAHWAREDERGKAKPQRPEASA